MFCFSEALWQMKSGVRVRRRGWNGKGMWVALVNPNEDSPFYKTGDEKYPADPFIAMKTVQDTMVPWLASQTDLIAEDWEFVSD